LVTENTLFGDTKVSSSLQQSNETSSAVIPEEEEVDLNGKKKSYTNKFVIKYQE
jgi:hypothetical protein